MIMRHKYISVLIALAAVMSLAFGVKAGSSNDVTTSDKQDNMTQDLSNTTRVLLETTFGEIELALYNETPQHRDNFVKLVNDGTYNGVLFHRVIKDFMVQTGDPSSRTATADALLGEGGPGYDLPKSCTPSSFTSVERSLLHARATRLIQSAKVLALSSIL